MGTFSAPSQARGLSKQAFTVVFAVLIFVAVFCFVNWVDIGVNVRLLNAPGILYYTRIDAIPAPKTQSISAQNITRYEDYDEYTEKEASEISNTMYQKARTLNEWNKFLQSQDVKFKPVFKPGQTVFHWEKEYLSFPPLNDSLKLPDLKLSRFTMDGVSGTSVSCFPGQRLTGRVDLHDHLGVPRGAGFDEIRAWMIDSSKKLRAVAEVKDLKNGSYSIDATCLWPGTTATLYVAVSYPREFLRAVVQQSLAGATRFSGGKFRSKTGVEEITLCNPTPNIPGRPGLCNFTEFNTREYYCGMPLDARLKCSDFIATWPMNFPLPYQVTTTEAKLIKSTPGSFISKTLTTKFTIVTSKNGTLPTSPSCYGQSPNLTWDITSRPKGFWNSQNQWTSLVCRRPSFTKEFAQSCLKDSHIYVVGDSNANRIFGVLNGMIQGKTKVRGAWPNRAVTGNDAQHITLEFRAHDYPLFLGLQWRPLLRTGSVESLIDSVPSTGRQIIILHYYLHLSPFHLTVAQSRVEAAANAIRRLLSRNPEARVAFRGPHVSSREWDINHSIGGDSLGRHYMEIIYKAFAGLHDKVVFLDGWELTTAIQNEEYHPTDRVPTEMIRTFLAFLCP